MEVRRVTAAPPTPNGDLHLGHLAGPYPGADIYARACRLRGRRSVFATGPDVHQSCVPAKARALGAEPLEMAQGFADEIAGIFASADLAVDPYVRPQHSALHRETVTASAPTWSIRAAPRAEPNRPAGSTRGWCCPSASTPTGSPPTTGTLP